MGKLKRVIYVIDLLSVWMGKIISWAAVVMMVTIVYDVVARYFFMRPTVWAEETNRFLLTGYFLLGGAYTLYYKGHVRMDVIYDRLSPRWKAITDLATFWMFLFCMALVVWFGSEAAWKSLKYIERTESYWAPPTFFVKITIPLSCLMMLLQGVAQLVRDVTTVITGKETTGSIGKETTGRIA
jgi:TRAP-type mannitol/chloroaromatic compound transport system permease small subunit